MNFVRIHILKLIFKCYELGRCETLTPLSVLYPEIGFKKYSPVLQNACTPVSGI